MPLSKYRIVEKDGRGVIELRPEPEPEVEPIAIKMPPPDPLSDETRQRLWSSKRDDFRQREPRRSRLLRAVSWIAFALISLRLLQVIACRALGGGPPS